MAEGISEETRAAYLRGVKLLLSGDPGGALDILEPIAESGFAEARLAASKAYIELRNGAKAREQLAAVMETDSADVGSQAYLHLLAAAAEALDDNESAAFEHLDRAQSSDPRMEHAARSLRRRLEKGRPPVIRF